MWVEIAQHAPEAVGDARLQRQAAAEIDPILQGRFSLQLGETAAIGFALQHLPALLLTDDEAARRACASIGLDAVGTIGLILEAARSKRVDLDEASRALEALPTLGRLHVRRELLNRAIAALRI